MLALEVLAGSWKLRVEELGVRLTGSTQGVGYIGSWELEVES
jgi:hypothetical protein